jgi:hypothetical protein
MSSSVLRGSRLAPVCSNCQTALLGWWPTIPVSWKSSCATQGFNSGSDKHGGNDSDHQQQPNQEESTRGSEAGEVNEGSLAERDNLGSLTGITIVRNVDQQLVDSK